MALKALLGSLDGLPADVAKEYTKSEDGKFRLAVEPVDGFVLENVGGLKSALATERSQREQFEKSLKSFEGLDPQQAREALKRLEEIKNWSPDQKVQEQIASSVKTVESKFKTELEQREAAIKSLNGALSGALIDQAATSAIAKLNGTPELLLPHIRSMTRIRDVGGKHVVEVIDPTNGTVRISPKGTSTSPMTIDELVEEMQKDKIFGRAFAGSGSSGGGAQGGNSGGGGGGGAVTITESDAKDITKYRRAREAAAKAGVPLTMVPG